MFGLPPYDRHAPKKIEKLLQNKSSTKIKNHAVAYKIEDLEKLIHTIQQDFSHHFCVHLNNTSTYFEHYEIPRFKKLSAEAYRLYSTLIESDMSYTYDEDYSSDKRFNELMDRQFTVFNIPYHKVTYFNRLWFTAEHHRAKIEPEETKLSYREMLTLIPKTLVIIEFNILAAEVVELKAYVQRKHRDNEQLQIEVSNILAKIKQCKISFKESGKFDKRILENIHQEISIIGQHRGLHNKETHPIFNKILDTLRSIMHYLTEFLTSPLQYCLPETRKKMVNFFSEPKTHSQKKVEHFLKEADSFMDEVNKLSFV